MWNPFKKKKKKKIEDLDRLWLNKIINDDSIDLDQILDMISNELGIKKSELDLEKLFEIDEDFYDFEEEKSDRFDIEHIDDFTYRRVYGKSLEDEFSKPNRTRISEFPTDPTPLEEFIGYTFLDGKDSNGNDNWEDWEGYLNIWKRELCDNTNFINESEMWNYFRNYYKVDISYSKEEPYDKSGHEKYKVMKLLRSYRDDLKKNKYDKTNKNWSEIDIGKVFRQIRVFMVGSKENQIPNFVWKFDFRPFEYSFNLCKDYVKWKGTYKTSKTLFENIMMWENGTLHINNEKQKEYTDFPIWVNWNVVDKFFLSMKTKLRKEKGGIDLLKEIGRYIQSRKTFYNELGEESDFNISTEIIEKFQSLK